MSASIVCKSAHYQSRLCLRTLRASLHTINRCYVCEHCVQVCTLSIAVMSASIACNSAYYQLLLCLQAMCASLHTINRVYVCEQCVQVCTLSISFISVNIACKSAHYKSSTNIVNNSAHYHIHCSCRNYGVGTSKTRTRVTRVISGSCMTQCYDKLLPAVIMF